MFSCWSLLLLLPLALLCPLIQAQTKSFPGQSQSSCVLACCWEKGFLLDAVDFQLSFLPTDAGQRDIGVVPPARSLGQEPRQ